MAKSDLRKEWEQGKALYPLVPAKFFNLSLGNKLDAVSRAVNNEYKYTGNDTQRQTALNNAIRQTGGEALQVIATYAHNLGRAAASNQQTPLGDAAGNMRTWIMLDFTPSFSGTHPILATLTTNIFQ